jgi:hypothetical protein
MHPYRAFSDSHFWNRSVAGRSIADVAYDPAPKFKFNLAQTSFATAGSCFAQHFGANLVKRGGRLLVTEARHPLIPEDSGHGYGVFSARYGNIYNSSQLRELVEQSMGRRSPIHEFCQRKDGRWIDAMRPRAVPDGFSSEDEAAVDRRYHLDRVLTLLKDCSVFVFTLGLTESWRNIRQGYSYGICPGVIAGAFDAQQHEFKNLSINDCVNDLNVAFEAIRSLNPNVKILLTVSPVMLMATAESRGVLQSSVVSKSILRAAADECVRNFSYVDYFPSFEIITGPQARGVFFDDGLREVREEGVRLVMDVFFKTRVQGGDKLAYLAAMTALPNSNYRDNSAIVAKALQEDCDEVFLGSV